MREWRDLGAQRIARCTTPGMVRTIQVHSILVCSSASVCIQIDGIQLFATRCVEAPLRHSEPDLPKNPGEFDSMARADAESDPPEPGGYHGQQDKTTIGSRGTEPARAPEWGALCFAGKFRWTARGGAPASLLRGAGVPAVGEPVSFSRRSWLETGQHRHRHRSVSREYQSGYTFLTQRRVVIEDYTLDTPFDLSPLLEAHKIRSGISVHIPGPRAPFGVLGAYSSTCRSLQSG